MNPSEPLPETPAASGFRMPAEWEPHHGTWLTWPWEQGDSFRNRYPHTYETFGQLIRQLAETERVFVNVWDLPMENLARHHIALPEQLADQVQFHHHPAYEPWCRDHGPVFLTHPTESQKAIVNWGYNAWGEKYPPFDLDDRIPPQIAELRNCRLFEPHMILEGGSIDVNGEGLLLTTESCLLHPNRNPSLNQADIEERLRDYLGIDTILWLGDGIVGDDTDGHIDDITRFVRSDTVVTAVEPNPSDPNHAPLRENLARLQRFKSTNGTPLEIIPLPMPAPVWEEGIRLPASYANFYIANQQVIVPTFEDPNDETALQILQDLFPDRRVVGLNSKRLVWGLGSFHCLTQQEPAVS